MIIRWCTGVMGQQSKIRMEEPTVELSGTKTGNGGRRSKKTHGEQGGRDRVKW
jgi:hypothetical protein